MSGPFSLAVGLGLLKEWWAARKLRKAEERRARIAKRLADQEIEVLLCNDRLDEIQAGKRGGS